MYRKIILLKLIVILSFTSVFSQKNIVGVVTNSNGEPFVNVKVSHKNNQVGVLSSENGEYKIEISDDCKVLIFTFEELVFQEEIKGRVVVNKKIGIEIDTLVSESYRFNVMLNAGGAVVFGSISGSVMLGNNASIDLGLGLGKAYVGFTLYLNPLAKNENWQPYLGINVAYFEEFMGPTSKLIYIPVGMRFLNYRGSSFSIEIAGLISNNDRFLLKSPIWGGVKFGKYF